MGPVSERADRLLKFGQELTPWLICRIEAMTDQQWRLFYDECEAGKPLPRRLEDSMPRTRADLVSNPWAVPEGERPEYLRAWNDWAAIWGMPPWKQKKER